MPETETSSALLDVARAFRSRLLAERDRIEASRRLPEDLARELAHAGFFRIFLPKGYGGLDLTPMEALEIFEELRGACGTATLIGLPPNSRPRLHEPCMQTAL